MLSELIFREGSPLLETSRPTMSKRVVPAWEIIYGEQSESGMTHSEQSNRLERSFNVASRKETFLLIGYKKHLTMEVQCKPGT